MALESRNRSVVFLWGAILLLPPLGLVLLWRREHPGFLAKLLASLGIAGWSAFCLYWFFGMRFQSTGTGLPTLVTFETQEDRFDAVDEHRAEQNEVAPEVPLAPPPDAVVERWTEFRGSGRTGIYSGAIRTDWGDRLEPIWRQPVGGGYASFSVASGRAFTIEQRRAEEVVAAYDVSTGREIWTHAWPAFFQEMLGGDGPRATPTWSDGFVYALGAEGELRKLSASSGQLSWRTNILEDAGARNITWGMAASPLVVDGKVITLPGGRGASVVAYDAESGDVVWRVVDDQAAYVAPMLAVLGGRRQLLVLAAARLMGLDLEAGELLWHFPWETSNDINVAQPVVVDETHVFVSAGYGHGAALVELTPGGDTFEARAVWQNINMKNKFTSSVLHQGYLYGLDEAILACVDAKTGERMWKGGRYGYGQILLASNHIVVLTEGGDLALVRATPDGFDEVSRFSAIEGKTWNHPAIADGILLVRNLREMAAFDLRGK
jgi:outer membrane protein assembly factor BamB